MDSDYRLYIQEVVDFLDGLVIKFSPFALLLNQKTEYFFVSGFDEEDVTTYPYYRILAGDEAFATEDILAFSPTQLSEVPLTRANVELYPDIVTFYKEKSNLDSLLSRYPNDRFLIKRILNPVLDIAGAISANNLTILPTAYAEVYINEHEYGSLMTFLQEQLWRIDYRWYISTFEYEDLYPYAFWGMLWNVLPQLLLAKRILNVRTVDVHPFHIWEYLTSLGFGKYRGYLTRDQELFLYRNARYLKWNAGKNFLLDILDQAFLAPLKYTLSEKLIISHTVNRESTHDKVPDIIPASGSVEEYLSSTNFNSFLKTIFEEGHDTRGDAAHLADITDLFSKSPANKLATKFIELNRHMDVSEITLLLKFILDSIAYLLKENRIQYSVNVQSPVSQNILHFDTVTDALTLFFYCIYHRDNPVVPFTKYTLTTAIAQRSKPVIPEAIRFAESEYYVRSYVDVDKIADTVTYINDLVFTPNDLSSRLGDQYTWVFEQINLLKQLSDSVEHESHVAVFRAFIPEVQVIDIAQPYASFDEFFTKYEDVRADLDNITEIELYGDLMYAIMAGICPIEVGFADLARDDQVSSTIITKIKELFMYMVSYNINFVNNTFEQASVFELPKITARIEGSLYNTQYINSIIVVGDDLYNSFDYRMSVTQNGGDTIITELSNIVAELDTIETSMLLNIEQQVGPVAPIVSGENIIYITSEGTLADIIIQP